MNGQQSGDPAKLAANLVKVVELDEAPAAGWPAPTPSKQSRQRDRPSSIRRRRTSTSLLALTTR